MFMFHPTQRATQARSLPNEIVVRKEEVKPYYAEM